MEMLEQFLAWWDEANRTKHTTLPLFDPPYRIL